MNVSVEVDLGQVRDWEGFHDAFSAALGFPDWYGRNMNAWIDLLTYVDDGAGNAMRVGVEPGQFLVLVLKGVGRLRKREPDILDALLDAVAFVNWRRTDAGDEAVLAVAYHSS